MAQVRGTGNSVIFTQAIRHGSGARHGNSCEQVVDVRVPQVIEQVLEVPKTASRDRTLQDTVEWVLDVLLPEMVKRLMKLPNAVVAPVPQVVEDLAEASKVFSQDRIQRRSEGQMIKTLGMSLAEKIIEMPVAQTRVAYAEDGGFSRLPRRSPRVSRRGV